ncbi:MAG: hypothetical protein J6C33_04880 [Lachnospiraceae bacterium]|nr:hypothetical protein [Lachnospiraceae bacterium]
MELIFKKYHKCELHTEKNYLIYDPEHNEAQFTDELFRSIAHRNFTQGCENLLIGPIRSGKKMTVRVLDTGGREVSVSPSTMKIFETYLKDQGYAADTAPSEKNGMMPMPHTACENIHEFGTVYYFPA